MKIIKLFVTILLIASISLINLVPYSALAVETGLEESAKRAGLEVQSPGVAIGVILYFILGFLGVILLIVIIYAGFLWMTAGGDEEQVRKAKAWILNGLIGLVITILAYAITNYVVERVAIATGA